MAGIHFLDARGPEGIVVYAIGDVHGRLDLLTRMHEEIAADRNRRKASDWRIIHLGDYVDRGPASKGVIDFLIRASEADSRVISLAGNHDIGFLEFLADAAPDWPVRPQWRRRDGAVLWGRDRLRRQAWI